MNGRGEDLILDLFSNCGEGGNIFKKDL